MHKTLALVAFVAFAPAPAAADLVVAHVLTAPDGAPGDEFGAALAASADASRIVIGAPGDDGGAGSARVFVRTGTSWTEEARLTAAPPTAGARFGARVAMAADGGLVLVASSTTVVAFSRSSSTWTREATLATMGEPRGVALSADGARGAAAAATELVFVARTSGVWNAEGRTAGFTAVDLDATGARAIVGAMWGSQIFVRSGTTWTTEAALTTDLGALPSGAVAIDSPGASAIVAGSGPAGALTAATFTRSGSGWSAPTHVTTPLTSSGAVAIDGFDPALLVDGGAALIDRFGGEWVVSATFPADGYVAGARDDDATVVLLGNTAGAGRVDVYFVDDPPLGASCTTGDDCLSGHCVDGVCCSSTCDGACEGCTAATTTAPDGVCAPSVLGTTCRPATDTCDAVETCPGTSRECPPDGLLSGVECRPSSGACDPAELCFGTSAACPPDQISPASMVCRASADLDCDPLEACDGTSATCPTDRNTCGGAGDGGGPPGPTPSAASCACRVRHDPASGVELAVAPLAVLVARRFARRRARRVG